MWKDLTMQQRAELMDIYLGHGITSLDDMRRDYDLRSSDTANTYREGGSIHISPSKKGTFTAAATKHGMGVQEFASKVLAHPENYSPAMRKKANFARNASKWHGLGGNLYDDGGLTDQQYYSIMEKVAEENNPKWNKFRIEEGGRPLSVDEDYMRILNDNSYDYRGYYNKYPNSAANVDTHWNDEFKTAWHPSFSDLSIYSGKKSQYNPKGIVGGHWYGKNEDIFIPTIPQLVEQNKSYFGLGGHIYDGLTEGSQQMNTSGTTWGYYTPTGERRYPTASDGETVDQTVDLSNIANPVVTYYRDTGKTNIENVQNEPVGYKSANHPEDVIPFFNDIYNLWNYSKGYLQNKLGGVGEGEVIDLSNKNVSRITSDTDDVASILTNDFVEHNNNVVRKKKDFINTTDTLLGDRKIPLSQISTFYGIEDGKLKVGPLDIFNDETVVVPNRAKYVGKIKEYHPMEPASEEYKEAVQNGIAEYNKSKGYEPDWLGKMLPFSTSATPGGVLYHNLIKEEGNTKEGRKRAFKRRSDIMASIMDKYSDLGSGEPSYIITENNDTIRDYQLNASPKALFADENGNAIFVAHPRQHVDEINNYLRNNPMYPIMVDNGRYAAYQTYAPNAGIYSGLNNPNDMFIVGTTKALGGHIYDGLTESSQQMDNSYSYIKPLSEVVVDNEGNVRDPLYLL